MFTHFYSYGEGTVTGRKTSQLTADRCKGNKYIIAESLSPEELKFNRRDGVVVRASASQSVD